MNKEEIFLFLFLNFIVFFNKIGKYFCGLNIKQYKKLYLAVLFSSLSSFCSLSSPSHNHLISSYLFSLFLWKNSNKYEYIFFLALFKIIT
jgi:hypothetical protein